MQWFHFVSLAVKALQAVGAEPAMVLSEPSPPIGAEEEKAEGGAVSSVLELLRQRAKTGGRPKEKDEVEAAWKDRICGELQQFFRLRSPQGFTSEELAFEFRGAVGTDDAKAYTFRRVLHSIGYLDPATRRWHLQEKKGKT